MYKKFIALIFFLCLMSGCNRFEHSLIFGVSAPLGPYEMAAKKLISISQNNQLPYSFKLKNTLGSAACIRLMSEDFLNLSIVQSDVMSDALYSRHSFVNYDNVFYGVIAEMFNELTQIVVPANSKINRVNDLLNKKISVGEVGTGTRHDAMRILKYHGLSPELVHIYNYPSDRGIAELMAGNIDALFLTDVVPSPVLTELSLRFDIRFIRIEPYVLKTMVRKKHGHLSEVIPAHTYKGQLQDVPALGCKVLLISNKDVDNQTVYEITKLVNEQISSSSLEQLKKHNTDEENELLELPYHPGAVRYYTEMGVDASLFLEK